MLLVTGAALVSDQRLLGHSGPKMTERRYGHLLPDFMASEVNRLRFGLDGSRLALRLRAASRPYAQGDGGGGRPAHSPLLGGSG